MPTYNLAEAKTHLGELIAKAQAGETVLIARRGGAPIARLIATESTPQATQWPRTDADWPREIMEFEGISDLEPFEAARTTLLPPVADPFA